MIAFPAHWRLDRPEDILTRVSRAMNKIYMDEPPAYYLSRRAIAEAIALVGELGQRFGRAHTTEVKLPRTDAAVL